MLPSVTCYQSYDLVSYPESLAWMEAEVAAIRDGRATESLWLLQHPPLYTAGISSKAEDLLTKDQLPVYKSNRGGQFTYHGPGQRVVYVMLDLQQQMAPSSPDLHQYIYMLEEWIMASLKHFAIIGERRQGRVGIWVSDPVEAKIASIGVRVRKWITYHGISININPDLKHFAGIIPCGIRKYGVTSCAALGVNLSLQEFDAVLLTEFQRLFARSIKHGYPPSSFAS